MDLTKIKLKRDCDETKDLLHDINNMFTIIDGESFKQFKALTPMDSKEVILNNNLYNSLSDINEVKYIIKFDNTLPEDVIICTTTPPENQELYYDLSGIITINHVTEQI